MNKFFLNMILFISSFSFCSQNKFIVTNSSSNCCFPMRAASLNSGNKESISDEVKNVRNNINDACIDIKHDPLLPLSKDDSSDLIQILCLALLLGYFDNILKNGAIEKVEIRDKSILEEDIIVYEYKFISKEGKKDCSFVCKDERGEISYFESY